jgi:AcrR family transcriptional regulator
MGRPSANRFDVDTPTRILDAAEHAFAIAGLAGAKLADIAGAAGIRRPSLLYHFTSKERLYGAVVERAFDVLGATLVQAMEGEGDFETRLHRTLDRFVEFLDERPYLARLIVRQMIDGGSPGQAILLEQVGPLLDTVQRFIEREGAGRLRATVDVRNGILTICSGALVRAASGSLREPLWGRQDHMWAITEALLFGEPDGRDVNDDKGDR